MLWLNGEEVLVCTPRSILTAGGGLELKGRAGGEGDDVSPCVLRWAGEWSCDL